MQPFTVGSARGGSDVRRRPPGQRAGRYPEAPDVSSSGIRQAHGPTAAPRRFRFAPQQRPCLQAPAAARAATYGGTSKQPPHCCKGKLAGITRRRRSKEKLHSQLGAWRARCGEKRPDACQVPHEAKAKPLAYGGDWKKRKNNSGMLTIIPLHMTFPAFAMAQFD